MKQHVFRAYWSSFWKYKYWWLVTLISMTVSTSLQTVSPYYIRDIVNTFTSDTPSAEYAKEVFWNLVFIYACIIISYRVMDVGMMYHESHAMKDLDNRSFQAIQRQSMRFFEDTYSGSLITRARRFSGSYENIMDLFFFQFGKNLVMFVAITIAFINGMPQVAGPFIGWTVFFLAYCGLTVWWKYKYDVQSAEADSKVGAALSDSLTNHMAVKTFGQEASEEARFAGVVQADHEARIKAWMYGNYIMFGQVLIMTSGELALIWWMIGSWGKGLVTAGDFFFVQTFMTWAISHLWTLGMNLRRFFSAVADAEEMAEVYHHVPEVQDAPGARPLIVEEGEVEFHSVSFRYGDKESTPTYAIQNFSLHIPAGESIGLVGKSGAGKSTIVKLLLRFYDVDSGFIRIDRQDIANVTQVSLRQQLAVVLQDPHLFHRSIRENIAFARPDASDDEIIDAAKQACAWDFIQELPQGLDTLVGEKGVKLSGGQRQRIVIARAILADPRILILDEATSALDSETERVIQKAISNLLKGRTAIVIAHRLSTITRMDRIIVMERGIIESGTHDDLIAQKGAYAKLWSHQTEGFIA